jgi:hypothetical protein
MNETLGIYNSVTSSANGSNEDDVCHHGDKDEDEEYEYTTSQSGCDGHDYGSFPAQTKIGID